MIGAVSARTRSAVLALAALTACSGDTTPLPDAPSAASASTATSTEAGTDPTTGLIIAEDWELVAANCVGCHSAQQFLRQRGTAATWREIIDWMQATQGLWQFEAGVEERIVSYLATHYGPDRSWRRAPLPASALPPNPYAAEAQRALRSRRLSGDLPKTAEQR